MEETSREPKHEAAENQIIEYLTSVVGKVPRPSDSLALLGVDSVAMAELTFELEKRFGIQIDDDILDVDTIRELTQYVTARVQSS
jgi:acyl carrier protein